jgi:hypothetical protein
VRRRTLLLVLGAAPFASVRRSYAQAPAAPVRVGIAGRAAWRRYHPDHQASYAAHQTVALILARQVYRNRFDGLQLLASERCPIPLQIERNRRVRRRRGFSGPSGRRL